MKYTILSLAFTLFCITLPAQPQISFDTVVTGLALPLDVVEVNDGSGRLFIVEKKGTIRIWNGTSLAATPFLNILSRISTGPEQGLLSLAFHPNYATNGYFFVYYTAPNGNITIDRYTRLNATQADTSTRVNLFSIPKPYTNHNGGKLLFGPDGYLYFGTGDGGAGGDPNNYAQNNAVYLGKMLRVDVNNANPPYYSIPPSNPFFGSTTAQQEIIANGLRNPWRYSFDKQTGDMWIADVGQNLWEEVNYRPHDSILNKNYGWHCFEATHVYGTGCGAQTNNVYPIFEYPHSNATGGYSITGGYVYRGTEYPWLQGYYLFADYVSGNGWLTYHDAGGGFTTTRQSGWAGSISSFGQASDGTLYATALSGELYKIVAAGPLPVKLVSFGGKVSSNKAVLNWQVQQEQRGDEYIVEERTNAGEAFVPVYSSKVVAAAEKNTYTIELPLAAKQTWYRLKIVAIDGQVHYSKTVQLSRGEEQLVKAFVVGSDLQVQLPEGSRFLTVYDGAGKEIVKRDVSNKSSLFIPLGSSAKGLIVLSVLVNDKRQVIKVAR